MTKPRKFDFFVCKPCWELKYCPYGSIVEHYPLFPGESSIEEVESRYEQVLKGFQSQVPGAFCCTLRCDNGQNVVELWRPKLLKPRSRIPGLAIAAVVVLLSICAAAYFVLVQLGGNPSVVICSKGIVRSPSGASFLVVSGRFIAGSRRARLGSGDPWRA